MIKYEIVSRIVNDCQAEKIMMELGGKRRKVLMDAVTANRIKQVFEAVTEEKRAKLEKLGWEKLVAFAWRKIA